MNLRLPLLVSLSNGYTIQADDTFTITDRGSTLEATGMGAIDYQFKIIRSTNTNKITLLQLIGPTGLITTNEAPRVDCGASLVYPLKISTGNGIEINEERGT